MKMLNELGSVQVLISLLVIAVAVIIKIVTNRMLRRISQKFSFNPLRKIVVSKIINISLFFTTGLILLGIWEVDPNDLALYLASIFTVLGIAFFHQRSHLSNITAGILLFFNHPVKIGDRITIHEGDHPVQGKIDDIGIFFVTLSSNEDEKTIISNTQFLQKIVSVK